MDNEPTPEQIEQKFNLKNGTIICSLPWESLINIENFINPTPKDKKPTKPK
jgi:hypothetical protein